MALYPQPKQFNLPEIEASILKWWKQDNVFKRSLEQKAGAPNFVFYEGPPSANGMPGIHHVMSRALKDLFCRYKSLKGYQVNRKGGWDTHGLPVELGVEKKLGITKEDIGTKISVQEYNQKCREAVMEFKGHWDSLTEQMGYWVDLEKPYVTFEQEYMESLWGLLKRIYDKGLMYKGYTVQPYSPAAGTGLSSHELNLPGCYKDVKDTTVVAQFQIENTENEYFLAWTTTPWTLPSNTALTVGAKIQYVKVESFNPYTKDHMFVWLAEPLLSKHFNEKAGFEEQTEDSAFQNFNPESKLIPFRRLESKSGKELEGTRYIQLFQYHQPTDGDAFKVICGDFVTTEDGTGIVHTAPSFGADDMLVAKQNGIGSLTLVDKSGKFIEGMGEFSGLYVKDFGRQEQEKPTDVLLAIQLKERGRAFKVEKYEHSYPHCWRTDKPILYYPLDSWFIKTTAVKDKLVELNKTINWKPEFTGSGRFGNWLENLVDWNLSRSRYWGTPLPIWRTEDGTEEICIGSVAELKAEVQKAIDAGIAQEPIADDFDLHRPYVDEVYLVSPSGKKMFREPDLIDVWFDSGAMPYAQWGYPHKNEDVFKANFPADFIAEGVDQTRGWFFTLHAIAVMLEDSVAYKNVIANGLVLDKDGNKMSKRLGNGVDPFDLLPKVGADAVRFYMMANSQPWDNLKFDVKGIEEIKRKFFSTVYNTYSFFALYANVDGYTGEEKEVPYAERSELDKWILSSLNTLIQEVDQYLGDFEPTKAARAIMHFVDVLLSNWYVRLSRRRFWKGEMNADKLAAYQTLEECLITIAKLMAPITPFFADWLFTSMKRSTEQSIHETTFPSINTAIIDSDLERRMGYAQTIASLILSIRKKENIKVRQPLAKVEVPEISAQFREDVEKVKDLILSEVNVKELNYMDESLVKKTIKPNFKALGPIFGKQMKLAAAAITNMSLSEIQALDKTGEFALEVEGEKKIITKEQVEIQTILEEGKLSASENGITVTLDATITPELATEGFTRELVNRIQNLRKDTGLNITDRIHIKFNHQDELANSIEGFSDYICAEVLAKSIEIQDVLPTAASEIEVNGAAILVHIEKA